MESDELTYFETIFRLGIDPRLLRFIPEKIHQIEPHYDDGFLLKTDKGNLALWIHRGPEAYLACQLQILQLCLQENFKGCLYPIQLTDGRNYAEFGENCWFYITPWPEFQKIRFSNQDNLKAIVNLLAFFRKIIHESGFLFYLSEKRAGFNLLQKYPEILKQLDSFEMLAVNRLRPTEFDRQFLGYLQEIRQQIKVAFEILEKSAYLESVNRLASPDIIINKLTRHNLGLDYNGNAVCFQLDAFRWDLPIIDLAIFLIKTGRSSRWNFDWYQMILKEYESHFSISKLDQKIIHSYMAFPWSFYRLASRYYYNRVEWTLRSFIEKMARVMEDEPNRIKLLEKFKANF